MDTQLRLHLTAFAQQYVHIWVEIKALPANGKTVQRANNISISRILDKINFWIKVFETKQTQVTWKIRFQNYLSNDKCSYMASKLLENNNLIWKVMKCIIWASNFNAFYKLVFTLLQCEVIRNCCNNVAEIVVCPSFRSTLDRRRFTYCMISRHFGLHNHCHNHTANDSVYNDHYHMWNHFHHTSFQLKRNNQGKMKVSQRDHWDDMEQCMCNSILSSIYPLQAWEHNSLKKAGKVHNNVKNT